MGQKLSQTDIIDLTKDMGTYYSNFFSQCQLEDEFYNLEFKVEKTKVYNVHRPATARLAIDEATDQVDTSNIRIAVRARNSSPAAKEQAEDLRRGYLGFWHRVFANQGMVLQPITKSGFQYGIGWCSLKFDADMWANKPRQKSKEDQKDYMSRLSEWREGEGMRFPFVLTPLNPQWVFPDPSMSKRKFVIEKYKRQVADVADRYPDWPKGARKLNEWVDWLEYWDDEYVAYYADGKEVMAAREHYYGFLPYFSAESGFGYISSSAAPEARWRGILHSVHSDITAQARSRTMIEANLRDNIYRAKWFQSDNAIINDVRKNWNNDPGALNIIPLNPSEATFNQAPVANLGADVWMNHNVATAIIDRATVARVARGEASEGAASGYKTALQASLARMKYGTPLRNLERMCEQINEGFAMMVENLIPDGVTVWATTPAESFDQTIKPKDINGYYENSVKLKAISAEEEDRIGMFGLRLFQAGAIDPWTLHEKYLGSENPTEEIKKLFVWKLLNHPRVIELMADGLIQTQQLEEYAEQIVGEQMPGGLMPGNPLGNRGIPPGPQSPMPSQFREQSAAVVRGKTPGSFSELDLITRQMAGEVGAGRRP